MHAVLAEESLTRPASPSLPAHQLYF